MKAALSHDPCESLAFRNHNLSLRTGRPLPLKRAFGILGAIAFSLALAACSGGGGGGGGGTGGGSTGGGGTTTTGSSPSISAFFAANATIPAGASTTLTAYFSGGTGSVDNGVGVVTYGVPVSVTPASTTAYVLTVTSSTGATATASTTVTVVPPVVLQIGTPALPYSGTVGTNSSGYYQITGMTPGHRYAISITATNYPAIAYYSDAAYTNPIKCDPNVGTSACIIEAPGTSIWVRITNTSYFNASAVTIDAVHVSAPTEFEGTWTAPVVLDYSTGGMPHVGKVDKYNSYYSIRGLTIGKQYTFWLQSMTDDARMGTLDPVARTWLGGYCNPDKTWLTGFSNPESCTWVATDTKLEIGITNTSLSAGIAYILRVEEAVASEGSASAPVLLTYASGKASAVGRAAAAGSSYYRVTGLVSGTSYILSMNGLARSVTPGAYDPPAIQPYGADSTYTTASACVTQATVLNSIQCKVTASGTDLFFKIAGPASFGGVTYNLAVTPVPVNEGTAAPVPLSYATNVPYKGQVLDWFSTYTVSGLVPNTYYQVFLRDLTGLAGLEAWENTSTVVNCSDSSDVTATCALYSGPNGIINVRVGAISNASNQYSNSFFTLDVKPAFQLAATTTYRDTSGPIAIPDPGPSNLPVTPVSVPITVSGSAVTSISDVTVEFFVTHGYATQLTVELVAPNGTVVTLVAPNILSTSMGGPGFLGTQLNDYAAVQLDGGGGSLPYPNEPYYGTYRPRLPLHVLRGMSANGTWTLRVTDNQYINISNQTGEYRAWGISFK